MQRGGGDRALVVQTEDPTALLIERSEAGAPIPPNGDEVAEATFYGPLRVYRDALRPDAKKMLPRLDVLILSYRDPQQTVFDMTPKAMRRYLAGRLGDEEFGEEIRITTVE